MIAVKVPDQEIKYFRMDDIKHSSLVMSEALSMFSKLKKPDTGFEKIVLGFSRLDEKVSETVLDQFSQHAKNL